MKNIKDLDELQLLKRGNIFKHGLFSLGGLLLINVLLYSFGIEWAQGKWAELTIILFTVALCSIEFICCDIYPLGEKRQKILICLLGLLGLTEIVICVYELINEHLDIITDGKITDSALAVAHGLMFFSIYIAYNLRSNYNKRHENEE